MDSCERLKAKGEQVAMELEAQRFVKGKEGDEMSKLEAAKVAAETEAKKMLLMAQAKATAAE